MNESLQTICGSIICIVQKESKVSEAECHQSGDDADDEEELEDDFMEMDDIRAVENGAFQSKSQLVSGREGTVNWNMASAQSKYKIFFLAKTWDTS